MEKQKEIKFEVQCMGVRAGKTQKMIEILVEERDEYLRKANEIQNHINKLTFGR